MADTRVTTFSRNAEQSRTTWRSNQFKDERILGYVLLVPPFLSLNVSSVSLMLAYPTFLVLFGSVPVVIVYSFFGEHYVSGMTGAVKG